VLASDRVLGSRKSIATRSDDTIDNAKIGDPYAKIVVIHLFYWMIYNNDVKSLVISVRVFGYTGFFSLAGVQR